MRSAHSHSRLVNDCVSGLANLEKVTQELRDEVARSKAENDLLEKTNRSLRAQIENSGMFWLLLPLLY